MALRELLSSSLREPLKAIPVDRAGLVLARQLDLSPSAWASYAERDETRREHLAELQASLWAAILWHWALSLACSVADADGPSNQSWCCPGSGGYRRTAAAIGL
jgi:Domain of unknown function (DUF4158)